MTESSDSRSHRGETDVRETVERCGRWAAFTTISVVALAVIYFAAIVLLSPR